MTCASFSPVLKEGLRSEVVDALYHLIRANVIRLLDNTSEIHLTKPSKMCKEVNAIVYISEQMQIQNHPVSVGLLAEILHTYDVPEFIFIVSTEDDTYSFNA